MVNLQKNKAKPNLQTNSGRGGLFARVATLLSGGLALSALGTWLGQSISGPLFWVTLGLFILGAIGVPVLARKSVKLGIGSLAAWVFVSGLFLGPAINQYASQLGWGTVFLAYVGTGAVMAACGAIGALSGKDFSGLGRVLFPGLLALIAVSFVGVFISFGAVGNLVFSLAGMGLFALFFVFDFFRLAKSENNWQNAISLTMSLYLDFINFLLFFLRAFGVSTGRD